MPWYRGRPLRPVEPRRGGDGPDGTGRVDAARAAYAWLAAAQLGDGSWFNYYLADAVKDARLDTNVCAYVAAGLWHYSLATDDVDFVAGLFCVVERGGRVRAALAARPTARCAGRSTPRAGPRPTRCSPGRRRSTTRCAARSPLAERLGEARPAWELAAGRLGHAVAHHPGAFAPKNEFAMDWYYPVLCGALAGEAARQRLDAGWERHVLDGRGVRCVSTSDWVTAAETAECAIALDAVGATRRGHRPARACTRAHRRADGVVLDRPRLPRRADLPRRRDDVVHRGRGAAGRRRAELGVVGGVGALPPRGAAARRSTCREPGCRVGA